MCREERDFYKYGQTVFSKYTDCQHISKITPLRINIKYMYKSGEIDINHIFTTYFKNHAPKDQLLMCVRIR